MRENKVNVTKFDKAKTGPVQNSRHEHTGGHTHTAVAAHRKMLATLLSIYAKKKLRNTEKFTRNSIVGERDSIVFLCVARPGNVLIVH